MSVIDINTYVVGVCMSDTQDNQVSTFLLHKHQAL